LTDRGIVADRKENFDRMILHYMPPHRPYIAEASGTQGTNDKRKKIRITESPRNFTYDAYLDNLRWALTEVKLLLDNIDRQNVVITADHGECFSSWFPAHVSGQLNPTVEGFPGFEQRLLTPNHALLILTLMRMTQKVLSRKGSKH
jgi:hypothetical protein